MSLRIGLVLCLISLFVAIASLAWQDKLNFFFTEFYGYSSRISLNLPANSVGQPEDINLILPAFNTCTKSCPANLMLAKTVFDSVSSGLNLVVLSVQPERDTSPLLKRYAEVTGREAMLLDKDYPASWSLFAKYEQIRAHQADIPEHAGLLYLYQHSSQTLLIYPVPDAEAIISDITRLKTGVNHD